jgi:hypothetical protein
LPAATAALEPQAAGDADDLDRAPRDWRARRLSAGAPRVDPIPSLRAE